MSRGAESTICRGCRRGLDEVGRLIPHGDAWYCPACHPGAALA